MSPLWLPLVIGALAFSVSMAAQAAYWAWRGSLPSWRVSWNAAGLTAIGAAAALWWVRG